jgi:hypothetical protein
MYSPSRYAMSVQTIRHIAEELGRDLTAFDWYAWVFVNVNPDGDLAREQTAVTLSGNYSQDFRKLIDSVAAAGTALEVKLKLQGFEYAGASHLILMPAVGDDAPLDVIRRLFDEVLPFVTSDHGALKGRSGTPLPLRVLAKPSASPLTNLTAHA